APDLPRYPRLSLGFDVSGQALGWTVSAAVGGRKDFPPAAWVVLVARPLTCPRRRPPPGSAVCLCRVALYTFAPPPAKPILGSASPSRNDQAIAGVPSSCPRAHVSGIATTVFTGSPKSSGASYS